MAERKDADPKPIFTDEGDGQPSSSPQHPAGKSGDSQAAPGFSDDDLIDSLPGDGTPGAHDEELAQAQEKIASYHDELLRARAEVENVRRRAQEDVSKARKFSIEGFAESLVPVIDSLEAAMLQPDQDASAWQEGVDATHRQLLSAFERHALQAVAPEVGDRFDPHLHQAISTIPSDQPEGVVVQRLQKGYTIADRVLRPALVMVSAGPQA
ncbi:MAG TPA: nucleotide exchange factor GrpE [Burkholderiaceae bacterium]|nr:nucleotide exchange factor GrpE [Burkholderiaceae bacterium]